MNEHMGFAAMFAGSAVLMLLGGGIGIVLDLRRKQHPRVFQTARLGWAFGMVPITLGVAFALLAVEFGLNIKGSLLDLFLDIELVLCGVGVMFIALGCLQTLNEDQRRNQQH